MTPLKVSPDTIAKNIALVCQRIGRACERSGRSPDDVTLIAVTKTQPVEAIVAALECGIFDFGENRVQEAKEKIAHLPSHVRWHLIGSLQRNKVKSACTLFQCIHSIDRPALVPEFVKQQNDIPLEFLMQVNVAEESSKHGVSVADAIPFAKIISAAGLHLNGLMTVAPYNTDPEQVRPVFRQLRELSDEIKTLRLPGVELRHLSMGMSGDYEVAIEEGATMVRIGSALFGERESSQ